MDFLSTRNKNIKKDLLKKRKSSTEEHQVEISQATLFAHRRSISQPDLSIIDSIPSIQGKRDILESVPSAERSLKISVPDVHSPIIPAIEYTTPTSPKPIESTEVKPRVSTFKLEEKKSNPLLNEAVINNTANDEANIRKKALMNRLTADMSSNQSFHSSSLLRNPEYRRTIAGIDANLVLHGTNGPRSSPPIMQLQNPTFSRKEGKSGATTLDKKPQLPTVNSAVIEKFPSFENFEEASFASIDIAEDVETKHVVFRNNGAFIISRSSVPTFLKIFLFFVFIVSTAALSFLDLFKEPAYYFIPSFFVCSILVSNVVFFSLDIPKSSSNLKDICTSYPLSLSLMIGIGSGLLTSGIIAYISALNSWVSYCLFLTAGCSLILIICEIMSLSLQSKLAKSIKMTFNSQIHKILQLCVQIRKKQTGAPLDLYDNFFSRTLFSELKDRSERITKKSVGNFTNDESIFDCLNVYDNQDIIEIELNECIEYILRNYLLEIEEKKSIFSICQRIESTFLRFGFTSSFIVIGTGLLGFPIGILVLFIGLFLLSFLIKQILYLMDISQCLRTRKWKTGDKVLSQNKVFKIIGFNYDGIRLDSEEGSIEKQYKPFDAIVIKQHRMTYRVDGLLSKDQRYLLFKGLSKKCHRYTSEIKIDVKSDSSLQLFFCFKRDSRNCIRTIQEVLGKNDIQYSSISLISQ